MKFAIIGTNFVSDMFMEGATILDECEVVAVCSKKIENSKKFAEKYSDISLVEMHRLMPHEIKGEGHFSAVFEKSGEVQFLLRLRQGAYACLPHTERAISRGVPGSPRRRGA